MKKVLKVSLICILVICFLYCTFNIVFYYYNDYKNKNLNNDLKKIAFKIDNDQDSNNEDNKDLNNIEINFDELNKISKNIKAWMYMDDSIINYPVLKYDNNNFYLNHSVDGKYNPNGAIFIDYRNNEDLSDKVTYIYGHHMKNNEMFGDLELYKKQDYYENHKKMQIITPNDKYDLEILASFTTEDGSKIYNYINSKDNTDLVKYAKSKSNIKSDATVNEEDNIVILSTCSYAFENARYVVVGVLKK